MIPEPRLTWDHWAQCWSKDIQDGLGPQQGGPGPGKKFPGNFFLTGTGLVDPVRDGKFPGNGLLGKGQSQKSAFQEAPRPRILAWTLNENKNSLGIFILVQGQMRLYQ